MSIPSLSFYLTEDTIPTPVGEVTVVSLNQGPTGTHKDIKAAELVEQYTTWPDRPDGQRPQLCIISMGSCALAVQHALRQAQQPSLHVVVSHLMAQHRRTMLAEIGCLLHLTNLSHGLKPTQIKAVAGLTDHDIDLTSYHTRVYAQLAQHILQQHHPDHVYVPYGTGQLWADLAETWAQQPQLTPAQQPILHGVRTSNPQSQAIKLYSDHLPFARAIDSENAHIMELEEAALMIARRQLERLAIDVENSGAAGWAGYLQNERYHRPGERIVVVNTGRARLPSESSDQQ